MERLRRRSIFIAPLIEALAASMACDLIRHRCSRKWIVAVLAIFLGCQLAGAQAASNSNAASPTVVIDTGKVVGQIDRRILGTNEVWPLGMAGAVNLSTDTVYPSFDRAMREASSTALRYPGGTVANLFHWKGAIGPQDERLGQTSTTTVPFDSVFGPDEFGSLLETYGLRGTIVVNTATGNAAEAADWVAYMTGRAIEAPSSGPADPHYWSALRAQNGHKEPYPVDYWEVGNEIGNNSYWMAGSATAFDVARGCTTAVCRYTFGGYGHFNNQRVGTYDDFTAAKSISNGTAGQFFYVQYPPVAPGSAMVMVNGQTWTEVSSLSGQGQAYTLDTNSGIIRFGDGVAGQVPPSGAQITITYDSGPHDGFVDFYKAMKAANPNAKICSAFGLNGDPFVIQNAQYDCVISHPYISGPSSSLPLSQYHPALMLAADTAESIVVNLQQQIAQYQPKAEVVITEYGHLGAAGPSDFPSHFHLTLSEGLYTANALLRWAQLDLPFALRHKLVDFVFTPLPVGAANVGATENAAIAGPDPFVSEPQAKVLGLFSRTMGTQRLDASIANNPTETGSWGVLPDLEVLASQLPDGTIGVIVINQSLQSDVTATLLPQHMVHGGTVNVLTVNGPSATSYNTQNNPNIVDLQQSTITVGTGSFDYTFPAHSVTGFILARGSGR